MLLPPFFLATLLPLQGGQALPLPPVPPVLEETAHGIPGELPGTERWCVTFKERSFDLGGFRKAIREGRSPEEVRAIVRDLEEAARRDQAAFARFIENDLSGRVVTRFWLINACTIEVKPSLLDRVRKHPRVAFLHPDEIVEPVAILTSTNYRNHAVDALQKLGVKGKGVSVAIMDTGCDVNMGTSGRPHSTYYVNGDIKNKTGGGIGGSRLLAAKALGRMPADDVHNHGTGVSGIAAGEKWNTKTNSDRGHAPMAGVVSYSIANNTRGSSDYTTMAKAWQAIAADKATYKIVAANNSYTGSYSPTNIVQQALDAAALNADILPVVAAGNSASSTFRSQACVNGLAVGAVNPNTRKVASFSSRGPLNGDTRRFYPDLCANGVGTVMPLRNNESSQYIASGTSMASPQVCGAATLFRSVRTTANALETKAAILATTEDVSKQNTTPPYNTRNAYGLGYLRDDRLIALAQGKGLLARGSLTSTVKTKTFSLSVVKGKAYAAVISWNRSTLTSTAWSDLSLEAKFGTTSVAKSDTPRNLYEKVVFIAPATGTVTLVVMGTLDKPSVPFAIAAIEVPPPFIPGSFTSFGKGCPGTGLLSGIGGVAPKAYATKMGTSGSTVPIGYRPLKFQEIVKASELPSVLAMNGIAFRRDDRYYRAVSNYWIQVDLDIGYSAKSPRTMSRYFASNISGTLTRVATGRKYFLPNVTGTNRNPANFEVKFPFTKPFVYVAKIGKHLLFQMTKKAASTGTGYAYYYTDWVYDRVNYPVSYCYSLSLTSTYGYAGLGFGPILGFLRKQSTGAIPALGSSKGPLVGQFFKIDLSSAKPSTAAALFLGGSNSSWGPIRLPFNLSSLGASACNLLTSVDLVFTIGVDGSGAGTATLAIPNDKNLIQGLFYLQAAVVDPKANGLGLAFTNGLQGRIGGQP